MSAHFKTMFGVAVLGLAAYAAYAESITLTSYYPSPYGSYQNLDVTGSLTTASLAVNGDTSILGKHAFRGNDSWLRLNQDGAFPSGTHTPGNFAPGALNVGGVAGWGNPGGGNAWFAGSVGIG